MTSPVAVRGLIEPEQGDRLAELAGSIPSWASIIEVGSHTGLSTCYMGLAATAHVFAVDPWGPPRPGSLDDPFDLGDGVYDEFQDNLTRLGLWPRVTPLRGTSEQVAAIWTAPVGMVFIDAIHTEEAVRQDVGLWADRIVRDGWLALHDYTDDPDHEYHGVAIVAAELERTGQWEIAPLVGSLWTAQRR